MGRCKQLQIVIVALALSLPAAAALGGNALKSLEGFDIKREPSRADWRYFIRAPDASREQLWAYHTANGRHLKDWAWGWRLGWVRVCAESSRPICGEVLDQALFDRALVVRAEAATRLGRRYSGSGDQAVVARLVSAYRDARNLRHGKPMFVQDRIMFALHEVGGDAAQAAAASLTASDPVARRYWSRLEQAP
jgi:hypothetical protein